MSGKVEIIMNSGVVEVKNTHIINENNEFLEDDFVLQTPPNSDHSICGTTQFVFEGDMDDIPITDFQVNKGHGNTDIDSGSDDFVLNKLQQTESIPAKRNKKIKIPSTVDLNRAISKVAYNMRDICKNKNVYAMVSSTRLQESDFYVKLTNSIWKSLLQFCNVIQLDEPNEFELPRLSADTPYLETYRFFDKIYHDKRISFERDPLKALASYRQIFDIDGAISSDWIPVLITKMKEKLGINNNDAKTIANVIREDWCYEECTDDIVEDGDITTHDDTITVQSPVLKTEEININDRVFKLDNIDHENIPSVVFSEDICEIDYDCDDEDCECDEDELDDDIDNADDEDGSEEDESEDVLSIEIQKDEGIMESIICINAWNGTSMVLYADLENMDISTYNPDDKWSWMKHFIPNALTCTEAPDVFMKYNDLLPGVKFIPIGKMSEINQEEKDPAILMGMYIISNFVEMAGDDLIKKISMLVETNVAAAPNLSHFPRTLQMDELFIDEKTLLMMTYLSTGMGVYIESINLEDELDEDDCDIDDGPIGIYESDVDESVDENIDDEEIEDEDADIDNDDDNENISDFAAKIALSNMKVEPTNDVSKDEEESEPENESEDESDNDGEESQSDDVVEPSVSDTHHTTDEVTKEDIDENEDKSGDDDPYEQMYGRDRDDDLTFKPIRKSHRNSKYDDI